LQWYAARWCPGVVRLVMAATEPAKVPETVISSLRARERDGFVVLPSSVLQVGDQVRIVRGPFTDQLALYAGQTAQQRVAVLLTLFGSERRVEIPERDIARVQ
jgi:transcriptional antiterminator RfaH